MYTQKHLSVQIMFRERHDLFRFHAMQGCFTEILHFGGDDIYGAGNQTLFSSIGLLLPQNLSALRAPPGVSFVGPQAILRAIGPRARFIKTLGYKDIYV